VREKINMVFYVARELLSLLAWSYIITKLFIFDIDDYVVSKFLDGFQEAYEYKLAIITGVASVAWIILGKRFVNLALYVSFYPFVIILYRLPVAISRYPALAVVFMPAIYEVITSIKSLFIRVVLL
jgi:hypothetical protein